MQTQEINRVCAIVIIVLSFIALLTVVSGYFQAPQPDEGTAAHIFQLSIMGLVPLMAAFLITADWKQPWRAIRPMAISAAAVVLAFGALYYLEHVYYVSHFR
ncbi:MAG: hypothetical protein ACM3SW_06220 [Actinomycetota bacterium]